MSGLNDWYLYGDSLSRCLVAVTPEFGSSLFTDVMTRIASLAPLPTSDKGQWYRALKGYFYMGPEGVGITITSVSRQRASYPATSTMQASCKATGSFASWIAF